MCERQLWALVPVTPFLREWLSWTWNEQEDYSGAKEGWVRRRSLLSGQWTEGTLFSLLSFWVSHWAGHCLLAGFNPTLKSLPRGPQRQGDSGPWQAAWRPDPIFHCPVPHVGDWESLTAALVAAGAGTASWTSAAVKGTWSWNKPPLPLLQPFQPKPRVPFCLKCSEWFYFLSKP